MKDRNIIVTNRKVTSFISVKRHIKGILKKIEMEIRKKTGTIKNLPINLMLLAISDWWNNFHIEQYNRIRTNAYKLLFLLVNQKIISWRLPRFSVAWTHVPLIEESIKRLYVSRIYGLNKISVPMNVSRKYRSTILSFLLIKTKRNDWKMKTNSPK